MFDKINIEVVVGSDPPVDLKVKMEIREDDELVDGIKKGLSINFKGNSIFVEVVPRLLSVLKDGYSGELDIEHSKISKPIPLCSMTIY